MGVSTQLEGGQAKARESRREIDGRRNSGTPALSLSYPFLCYWTKSKPNSA